MEKQSATKRAIGFARRHPILFNFLMMILVGLGVVWMTLVALDVWTDHGENRVVPSLKGMTYGQAVDALKAVDLNAELSDSIYDATAPAGTVVEQSPRAQTNVKPNRTVYLTVTAFSPKLVTFPNVVDMSLRQAQSVLEGQGLTNVRVRYVASEYKDLVLGASFNGTPVPAGARVPMSASITIDVGEGMAAEEDSVGAEEVYGVEDPDLSDGF